MQNWTHRESGCKAWNTCACMGNGLHDLWQTARFSSNLHYRRLADWVSSRLPIGTHSILQFDIVELAGNCVRSKAIATRDIHTADIGQQTVTHITLQVLLDARARAQEWDIDEIID